MERIKDFNLTMVRGDTLSFGLELVNAEQDIDAAYFTCKASWSTDEFLFQKTMDDGIETEDTGKYRIRVAPDDTFYLDPATYYYDFEIQINGDVFTLLRGALTLLPDVTREAV